MTQEPMMTKDELRAALNDAYFANEDLAIKLEAANKDVDVLYDRISQSRNYQHNRYLVAAAERDALSEKLKAERETVERYATKIIIWRAHIADIEAINATLEDRLCKGDR